MAIALVQNQRNSKTGTGALTTTFSPAPTEGNLLVAAIGNDRNFGGDAQITSAGWIRLAVPHEPVSPVAQVQVWAKIAGASETTSVILNQDGNVVSHLHIMEFSGWDGALPVADEAEKATGEEASVAATTSVDAAVLGNNLLIFITFMNGNPTGGSFSESFLLAEEFTGDFRDSFLGWKESTSSDQPVLTYTSGTSVSTTQVVNIGAPSPAGGGGALGLDLGLAI